MLIKRKNPHYLLYENWMVLHLIKLESPSLKDALCQVWLTLVLWFLRRFSNSVNVFLLFHNNLHLEKGRALHWTNLGLLHRRMLRCQVWLKLVLWFLRRRFLNFVNIFLLFVIISPWKRAGLFIWTNLIPFTQGCFNLCQVCLKFVQWFLTRRWKCEKFMTTTQTTTTTTDNGQIFLRKALLS